ncbi:hypothetical protein [Nocardia camponoti]|uniref:hypothetical protein n=1 Tax=Nocardia camponoti TaxID=1616106 RepID=UPI001666817C|nr:hypothetical protein [Nocardia camponoti]
MRRHTVFDVPLPVPGQPTSREAQRRIERHWRREHADCAADSSISSLQQARFVLTAHAECAATCLQYLAATAYSTGLQDDI